MTQSGSGPAREIRTKRYMVVVVAAVCLVSGVVARAALTAGGSVQTQAPDPLPEGAAKPIVQRACTTCHTVKMITNKRATQEEWAKTVDDMTNRGAQLSDDEIDKVIDYLAANFKPVDPDRKQPPPKTSPAEK